MRHPASSPTRPRCPHRRAKSSNDIITSSSLSITPIHGLGLFEFSSSIALSAVLSLCPRSLLPLSSLSVFLFFFLFFFPFMAAVRSSTAYASTMQLSSLSRRSLSAHWHHPLRPVKPLQFARVSLQPLRHPGRRSYADAPPPPPPSPPALPAPRPKKRFRFFKWLWRLTWLSGVGLTGVLAYSFYTLRHPLEQDEPDPAKKTLVILGV